MGKIINKKLPYECSGVGEFGHLESEHKGGLISLNNLRIQCKKCNTSLGSKNILLSNYTNMDQVMVESSPHENDYMEKIQIASGCEFSSRGTKRTSQRQRHPDYMEKYQSHLGAN